MSPWHIYALGGGWGHITRAISLARAAARKGIEVEILANSPWANLALGSSKSDHDLPLRRLLDLPSAIRFHILPGEAPFAETAQRAASWVSSIREGVLVVDTFPRGLGGELAEIVPHSPVRRVWVHRDIDPGYAAEYDLESFAQHFDLVLIPGEDAPLGHLPQAKRTAPWLIAEPSELLPRETARRELDVEGNLPIVAVSGSGTPGEAATSGELASRLTRQLAGEAAIVWLSPIDPSILPGEITPLRIWPIFLLLAGIDCLVGSGGYHTVYEARATGTPLVALPQPRRYDRQAIRLRPEERADSPEMIVAGVRAALASQSMLARRTDFANGTAMAVDSIINEG